MSGLLEAKNLSLAFGGVHAVEELSFSVNRGEIFSIIGPNGAGKTTLFNLISRVYDADAGSIFFDGQDITRVSPHRIAELGIARTFQNTELFENESLLRNMLIGQQVHRKTRCLGEALFLPSVKRQELVFRREAEDIIDLLDLQRHRDRPVANLPYGVRKMAELARALGIKPRLLLLDEPSSGLNPEETEDLSFRVEDINEELDTTIIMVEHDMNLVSTISHRVMALADGKLLAIGEPADIQSHPEVLQAYVGE